MNVEVNFDGIVGPSHNFGGLSFGNVASFDNRRKASNPRAAALQGLEKMKMLADLGIPQAVLPPHERPHLPTLRALGFQGSDAGILAEAFHKAQEIFISCCSSAGMWTANAATFTPAIDAADAHHHFTPANLSSKFHRSIEAPFTEEVLRKIFKDTVFVKVHKALPNGGNTFGDEGAANHCRFSKDYANPGIHLFVYGRYGVKHSPLEPVKYPARQTLEASQAIARLHQIFPERIVYAQQNPRAVDAGMFHNDVASVSNCHVFLYHEEAFVSVNVLIDSLSKKLMDYCNTELRPIKVPSNKISLSDAVSSYLFNSQIINQKDGSMGIICPKECQKIPSVAEYLQELLEDSSHPIKDLHYVDLSESMRNGGGPACLRLRVQLPEKDLEILHPGIILTAKLYKKLKEWIQKHYREKLEIQDLADPRFLQETRDALDELTKILNLGSIYSFQQK
jgi:succinylarginine dihydrolase